MIYNALSIAGSDPSGGAGIQADLKVFSAHNVFGMAAITALTAQNTEGVSAIHTPPADFVAEQIRMVFADIRVDAIKIGMIANPEIAATVANTLNEVKATNIVLDPVMIAKGGSKLLDNKAIRLLKKKLIKKATLLTPNIPEAEILTDTKIRNKEDMIFAANKLIELGARNVLIKGGHLKSKSVEDIFVNKSNIKVFTNIRHKTKNTHGTGCTLSSAIATFLSCGKPLKKSCELGIKYVNQAIRFNPNYGRGHGPINHLNSIIVNKKFS